MLYAISRRDLCSEISFLLSLSQKQGVELEIKDEICVFSIHYKMDNENMPLLSKLSPYFIYFRLIDTEVYL